MWKYFLKRFLLIFPTLLGITFVVFLISHFAPGGPLNSEIAKIKGSANLSGASTKQISQEEIELIKNDSIWTNQHQSHIFTGLNKLFVLIWENQDFTPKK